MKENENNILCHSNGFEREADPLEFQMENVHASSCASVPKGCQIADKRANIDDDKTRDSGKPRDREGPLCHSNGCAGGTELSEHEDKLWSRPKFESSIIVDNFIDHGEKVSTDSEKVCTNVSLLFASESDSQFYTDKNVQECELSEVIACYKESNDQIVKDICVDEGSPNRDKTLIEADRYGHGGLFVPEPCQDQHSGTTNGCRDTESGQDKPKVSTGEDITNSVSIGCGAKEVDLATIFLEGPKSSLEEHAGKDVTEIFGPGNVTQMGEVKRNSDERTADDVSEDEYATSSGRGLQDSVVQDSVLLLSNCDGNEAPKQLDEVPSVESILESLAVAFTSDDSKKSGTANSLHYNSKVESGAITFDFKSPKPAVDSHGDECAENSHEECLKSDHMPKKQHVNPTDQTTAPADENGSIMNQNKTTVDEPNTQSQDAMDHPNRIHRGDGESSFSSTGPFSGLITYSGPIVYSGSTSLRSDSSTTSTRSFAFPILQSEWNSSPVRMTKAEQRHIGKNRRWVQGLLCCRF